MTGRRRHVLVTNDFPPKIGGIQTYLWELWRRMPPSEIAVYTTPYEGAATFDARQAFPVERSPEPVIGPYPWLVERVNTFAHSFEASLVMLDPAFPLGIIGPHLDLPFGVVLHGAEVTVPARVPGSRQLLRRTLRAASLVVAAGEYALREAERCARRPLPGIVIPPGVDHDRFRPFDDTERATARERFGVDRDVFVVASVNRLVPRKGMDVLVRAAAELDRRRSDGRRPLRVLIGGAGRDHGRLARLIRELNAPVELLGRLPDHDVEALYGAADAMAMLCHDRWFGLEQEGFGISFIEAAAAGLPQVAGRSGGAHEAVAHGVTGLVVDDPSDPRLVAHALERLMADDARRCEMGRAARQRAMTSFDYDRLAEQLHDAIVSTIACGCARCDGR